ncbi:SidA/IucD/PvdA family monooxygenase [Methylobacterium sp. J-076]|uniref:SidA/IucD/PvdA family monooxygenase n=1 Tax=Methylobacterium sp. J-076 TaxID=2836655 RepID=UPI001FB918CB|nr:SidA/IucD/PvdA family monooxygenase [Methylobacterium sp. J-076]MCJ2014195.1 SidA/IucD/PvdA family monooxygenase [Methylobacterium sp. J-076]
MGQSNIAVVGCGPKAAAIVARAHCLNRFEGTGNQISVTVFEEHGIAAAWDGSHGYTDGDQKLCTPAERDLGFPYYSDEAFPDIAGMLKRDFSWDAFQLSPPHNKARYAEWVSRGRKPQTHREFANYIRFAFRQADNKPVFGKVTGIRRSRRHWTVEFNERKTGRPDAFEGFDGVVFTGPGPSLNKLTKTPFKDVYSGRDFWTHRRRILTNLGKRDAGVVIIGGGGTTAAIAAWLVRHLPDGRKINLVNTQGTLFNRTVNFFENRIFDDPEPWAAFYNDERRNFVKRLNRGVVWENVTDILSETEGLLFTPGRAIEIKAGTGGTKLVVVCENNTSDVPVEVPADVVVDASGFDAWWFTPLLPKALQGRVSRRNAERLEDGMLGDLSFDLPGWPRIHAPMHSQIIGPGYNSLMVLGGMAERVLRPYR